MATESTAIHDLLAGLHRKAVPDDPTDDVLFSGSRREDDLGAAPRSRHARGTEPPNLFAMPAPAAPEVLPSPHLVVSLPRPFQHMPAAGTAGIDHQVRTVRVSKNKKLYAIPAGLGLVVVVLLGVYFSGGSDKPAPVTSASLAAADETKAAVVEAPAAPAAMPVVTPIDEPAKPTVTPIEQAPVAAAPTAAPGELPRDAVAPPEVVPGSAFVAKHEPTVATATVPAAADAPAAATEPTTEATAETVAPAPKTKKAKRESARDRRAAKRAVKRTKREGKKVARVERTEKAAATSEETLGGNGALSITSGEPREVWVDGRNSKRMTPLRVLLKPGKHKVTLFDKEQGKAKTFDVEIKPNETTKVSK